MRSDDGHVPVARRDIDGAGLDLFPLDTFPHRLSGRARKTFRQDRSEHRRHMLGHHHRHLGERRRERIEQAGQGLRSAGRATDGENARRHQGERTLAGRLPQRRGALAPAAARPCARRRAP